MQCQVCNGVGTVPHVNCANVDCNRLFIACEACKERLQGCCCEECLDAPRLLRPAQLDGGYYGKFGTYAMNRLKKYDNLHGHSFLMTSRSITAGNERQLRKRQRHINRLKMKRKTVKQARLELKKRVLSFEHCHSAHSVLADAGRRSSQRRIGEQSQRGFV